MSGDRGPLDSVLPPTLCPKAQDMLEPIRADARSRRVRLGHEDSFAETLATELTERCANEVLW